LILAVLDDKDAPGICQALAPICASVILPTIRSERALPPEELAKTLSTTTPSLHYSIALSLRDALDQARSGSNPILLTGSLHFAGEALAEVRGEVAAFEECAQ
jgi:dihydrofolate synthase / folylpolyglutamate synthase